MIGGIDKEFLVRRMGDGFRGDLDRWMVWYAPV